MGQGEEATQEMKNMGWRSLNAAETPVATSPKELTATAGRAAPMGAPQPLPKLPAGLTPPESCDTASPAAFRRCPLS